MGPTTAPPRRRKGLDYRTSAVGQRRRSAVGRKIVSDNGEEKKADCNQRSKGANNRMVSVVKEEGIEM